VQSIVAVMIVVVTIANALMAVFTDALVAFVIDLIVQIKYFESQPAIS
jgi:hypothetical protein